VVLVGVPARLSARGPADWPICHQLWRVPQFRDALDNAAALKRLQMMFVVALTICHLAHAAEPICVQENVTEAIPLCPRRRASMNGCDLTLNPEERGYYNIDARRSGHENLSRWPHAGFSDALDNAAALKAPRQGC